MPVISEFLKTKSPTGSHAKGETGFKSCTYGFKEDWANFDIPIRTPKGTATKTAKLYPINTLLKLISKLVPIPKSFGPLSKNGSDTHQISELIVLNEHEIFN